MTKSAQNKRSYYHNYKEDLDASKSKITQIQFPKRSIAGILLLERSLKKLVTIFIVINVFFLFFSADYYISTPTIAQSEQSFLSEMAAESMSDKDFSTVVQLTLSKLRARNVIPLHLEIRRPNWDVPLLFQSDTVRDSLLRPSEKIYSFSDNVVGMSYVLFVLDVRYESFLQSLFQTCMIGFACFVVVFAYFSGSKDSDRFIVRPLSTILKVANKIIRTPLEIESNPSAFDQAASFPEKQELEFEEHAKILEFFSKTTLMLSSSIGIHQLNTVADKILTKKPGSILMPGSTYKAFVAKLSIVSVYDQMRSVDDQSVRMFVQELYDTVYQTTDRFLGCCSPVRDESFFLIWRLYLDDKERSLKSGARESSEAACLMVTAVLKICAKIALISLDYGLSRDIDPSDCSSPRQLNLHTPDSHSQGSVSDRSDKQRGLKSGYMASPQTRITNFSRDFREFATCVMDFGEVCETLVQTQSMVSVVYGGVDLLKTRKLERLTSVYSLPILLTEKVHSMLGECMKKKCRKIDIVMHPSTEKSQDLFSIDVSCTKLHFAGALSNRGTGRSGVEARRKHLTIKEHIISNLNKGAKNQVFFEDPDIQSLFVKRTEFNSCYRKSLDYYSLGAWDAAKQELERAIEFDPRDGACHFLYSFMESYAFQRPDWWRGYRHLE